jgi:biotin carboxyl carrier protein
MDTGGDVMSGIGFEGWEADVLPGSGSCLGGSSLVVRIGEREHAVRLVSWEAGLLAFEVDGRTVTAAVDIWGGFAEVVLEGRRSAFALARESGADEEKSSGAEGHGPVRAEIPGKILEVRVSEGDLVEAGQVLLIAEAMKMEHPIRATAAARVGRVHAGAGDRIAEGDILLELLPPDDE